MLDAGRIYDDRLATLQDVTAALSAVRTPAEVTAIAVTRGCAVLGAVGGAIRIISRDGQWMDRVESAGYDRHQLLPDDRVSIAAPFPICEVARTGQPICLGSEAIWRERYPAAIPSLEMVGHKAAAALPLIVEDRIIGAMGLTFKEPREFDGADLEFMMIVARLMAQALDRAGHFAAEQARADRLAGLQSVTAALSAVRTPAEVAGVVLGKGREVLGALGATVRVCTDDGFGLDRLEVPTLAAAPLLYDRFSLDQNQPACDVIQTGQPVWLRTPDQWRDLYPVTAGPILEAGYKASATLPLCIEGKAIGTLGFGFAEEQRFDAVDRDFMLALSEITAQALDRARLYAAEQERARAAEELARMRNTIMGMVTHELRTPLTAIVGFAEILEARWSALDDGKRLDWVAKIKQSAYRQAQLVEDVLLMSQLEQGGLVLNAEPVLIEPVARQAAAEIAAIYVGQDVQVSGHPDLVAVVDRGRMLQILAILLDNAAKYSPQDSPISLTWAREIDSAILRVTDAGHGIDADAVHHLFRPFGRLDGSRPRTGRGSTGLGLYLGRQLANAMGGDLLLESTSPKGSVRAPLTDHKRRLSDRTCGSGIRWLTRNRAWRQIDALLE